MLWGAGWLSMCRMGDRRAGPRQMGGDSARSPNNRRDRADIHTALRIDGVRRIARVPGNRCRFTAFRLAVAGEIPPYQSEFIDTASYFPMRRGPRTASYCRRGSGAYEESERSLIPSYRSESRRFGVWCYIHGPTIPTNQLTGTRRPAHPTCGEREEFWTTRAIYRRHFAGASILSVPRARCRKCRM